MASRIRLITYLVRLGLIDAPRQETPGPNLSQQDNLNAAIFNLLTDLITTFRDDSIYQATGAVTVANTAAETTLFDPGGVGTLTLPAGYFNSGKGVRITIEGVWSDAASAPTARIRIKVGAVTAIDSTAITLGAASVANRRFRIQATIVCRLAAVAGSLIAQGEAAFCEAGIGPLRVMGLPKTAINIINTDIEQALNVTWQWGTASPSNTITAHIAAVESLN